MSVIAIQADAAEAALDRDPELARSPLRTIRASAKGALEEMRRLLDVLRENGDGGELLPQPGLGQIGELVEHARGAGVDVTLAVDGEPRPLAPGLDLSAYRIVQEGLTNVRKHAAGAPARVTVTWAPRELALEVRDAGLGRGTDPADFAGGHRRHRRRHRARGHARARAHARRRAARGAGAGRRLHRPGAAAERGAGVTRVLLADDQEVVRAGFRLILELARPAGLGELSERRLEVLRLVGRGLSNAEIAAELVISLATGETHVRHVLRKLRLRDRVQAVVAYESGLVPRTRG